MTLVIYSKYENIKKVKLLFCTSDSVEETSLY